MKKLLLLFCLCISTISYAQNLNPTPEDVQVITLIPDPNFEQALIDLGYDTTLNGRVLTGNINFRTSLDISNKNISDLTGIEDFISLRTLTAYRNNLTSVDISSNSQLETVRFDYNNLTSITIGNHPNLYQLELHENNIGSVDLSNLPALKTVYLRANNLSSVDFSNNSLLETVSLQNNNAALTSLDFSNNLNLKDLFCSDNNISSLNITNNTNLRWLWCSNNNLTSLDLSHTPLLANLYCQNNQLTYLDVKNGGNTLIDSHFDFRSSGNPNLTCIQVDNATYASNTWTSYVDNFSTLSEHCYETYVPDNNFEAYLEANNLGNGIAYDDYVTTANISGLTFLNLAGQNVSDMTGINDFTALETLFVLSNASLSSIDLSGNTNLKDFRCGDTALSNLNISMLSSLETLDIGNTNIMSIDVSNNSTLKTFWAVGVPISSLDVSNNTALEFLHVANTNFPALDLSNNSNLKQLYAQNSGLETLNVKNGNNTNVTTFNTSGTSNLACINVDDETYSTTNWTTIDAANNFSEYCYETYVPDDNFEDYLETNNLGNGIVDDNYVTTSNISGLTSLNLASENISDMTGIEAFTALEILLVSNNTSLSSIDLSENTSLKDFRCNSTAIGNLDISMLTALEILHISNTNINTIDLSLNIALKALWIDNTPITALNVNNNTLLEFLHIDNTNFTTLNLSNNTNLTQLFAQNSGLESLDMKNGNNTNVTAFNTSATPNLTCINVDNVAYATTNWTLIDTANNFSEHCFDTYVPDDNFEQGLIDLGYDSVLDDYVATENINTITSLSLINKGISDFTGLEDFIGLTVLNIRNNINQTLDVTALTNLERLFCYSNPSMTSINITGLTNLDFLRVNNTGLTSLDLSTNTALEDLWAFNLTDMASNIDVSNNTLLDFLHLQNANQSGHIDISHLSNLRSLYLGINDITSLNVKTGNNSNMNVFETFSNPNLTCINVDDETYATANFTNIDSASSFSEHCFETYVPDDNFENYLETHNTTGVIVPFGDPTSMGNGIANDDYVTTSKIVAVTTLDISSKMIADITGIEDFTALEVLDFSTNGIGNFNLSNNNTLKELYCASNGMSSIDVAANTNLEILDCSDNSNLTIDVSTNVNLKVLNAANNGATSLNLGSINALEELHLANNDLMTIDFSNLSNLHTLDCNTNYNFTVSDYSPLTSLISLNITSTNLSSINLSANTALETLFMNFMSGFDLDLSNNTALTVVSVQSSDLTSLNIKNGNNANITSFDARFNEFTCIEVDDPTANYLSTWQKDAIASFEANCNVTSIPDVNFEYYLENHDASGNVVTVGSPISMGNGIVDDGYVLTTRISSVTTLSISSNSISDLTGIEAFTALTDLNCSENNLTTLDVSSNLLLEDINAGVNNLTTILLPSTTTTLTTLELYSNSITSIDLSQYTALTRLAIHDNMLLTSLNVKNGNNTNFTQFASTNTPNLSCILVDDVTYANTNWIYRDMANTFNEVSCDVTKVAIKVYLQGAMLNSPDGLMRDDLRVANMIPLISPYGDGTEAFSSSFDSTGANAIVDWVWIEIRNATNNTTIVSSQAALLQRDGDVVGIDATSEIEFDIDFDDYYVVIKHRNHLGIMSANTISLNGNLVTVDFTDASNEITFGSNAQTTSGMPTNTLGMWSGNANDDTAVQYSGTSPDTPNILSLVLNDVGNFLNFPTFTVSGYNTNDVNMDASIQYSGTTPDTPFILQNVLAHPGNFLNFSTYQITEQLPEN